MQALRPSPYCLLSLAADAGNGTFMDHVVTSPNLRRACRRVVGNCGAPGVDGMTVNQLAVAWPQHQLDIRRHLLDGSYRPAAIRRHAVPKPGGKGVRVLGIPTVLDRTVQQAIAQPLTALIDDTFSDYSFGFRPGRGAHDALRQAAQWVESGLAWVLHLDLEKFFDHAPHDLVLARLQGRVDDPRLNDLAARFLAAPFACGEERIVRTVGLPQGGPLSPLLANLLLDELDRRIHDASFAFCRYADDLRVYLASETEAHDAFAMIAPWIESGLKLRINHEKTHIGPVGQDLFLGHRMRPCHGHVEFVPSAEAGARLRAAVWRLLKRHRLSRDPSDVIEAVGKLVTGWKQYFGLCTTAGIFGANDRWVQSALRHWRWRCAHEPRRRGWIFGNPTPASERSGIQPVAREAAGDRLDNLLASETKMAIRECGLYEWPVGINRVLNLYGTS